MINFTLDDRKLIQYNFMEKTREIEPIQTQ